MSNGFGFDFGSMSVKRVYQNEKASVISVSTEKAEFSIRATKNGSVRFYDGLGDECELVSKEWLEYATKQGI